MHELSSIKNLKVERGDS